MTISIFVPINKRGENAVAEEPWDVYEFVEEDFNIYEFSEVESEFLRETLFCKFNHTFSIYIDISEEEYLRPTQLSEAIAIARDFLEQCDDPIEKGATLRVLTALLDAKERNVSIAFIG